jgi:hypothetical protein
MPPKQLKTYKSHRRPDTLTRTHHHLGDAEELERAGICVYPLEGDREC